MRYAGSALSALNAMSSMCVQTPQPGFVCAGSHLFFRRPNVFGNRETVLDGETGYLIPPRDAEAIANAIGT